MINKKAFLGKQLAINRFDRYSCPEPPARIARACHVHKFQVNDRNIFKLSPQKKQPGSKHILYLHGGAYVQCFNIFHWNFLAFLVKSTNCTIIAPDYPLAPVYSYKNAFSMVTALYKKLMLEVAPGNLVLMGDSSGGGFALALAQKLRMENLAQPGQIILLSPWLDIELGNPGIKEVAPNDPFLEKESLRQAGKLYAAGTSPDHSLLSPINGSLEGLGKIAVFAGSKEILVADTRKLNTLAGLRGINLTYYEYADMVHAWMFLKLPESERAKKQIVDLILHS